MTKPPSLMIPGPSELYADDLDVMGEQVMGYGERWGSILNGLVDTLGELLDAPSPYVLPGTGTLGLDVVVMNLLAPGQRVVVPETGYFGTRLAEVAQAAGLEVVGIPVEVGDPVSPVAVAAALPGAAAVLVTHVETSTGVRHPIEEIARVCRDAGAALIVDGIASIGAEIVRLNEMGIEGLVTSSQKGLDAPAGLCVVALSDVGRARMAARTHRPPSWYCDLTRWDDYRRDWGSWHPHPVTMPSNVIRALASSVGRIMEEGLTGWVNRRAALATRCREGLQDLGLAPIPRAGAEANLVVAAWADDPAQIQRHVAEHSGIAIAGGLGATQGKAIRVGLMGATATPEMVDRLLEGVRSALA